MPDLMKVLRTNRTDLVILNAPPLLLRFRVVRHGLPLICRSIAERDQFVAKTLEAYKGMRDLLSAETDSLLGRLRAGQYGRP